MTADLARLDASAQADLVRRGDMTPKELVEAAIARIESTNPALNAVISTRFDRARDEASGDLADGPFRGVPFLLKDLFCPMEGEPAYDGTRLGREQDVRAPLDSFLVRRFRAAGLVVVGRTNTPEFGLVPTTEPAVFGATRNPWDPARTAGGSSGGSAAAVAAGLVPFAHASDGGGSIRIPAACCGLVGLKPSRGRVSAGPAGSELARFLSVQFAVTRSVRDAAALLDVASGAEVGDTVVAPPPAAGTFVAAMAHPPRPLRIGLWSTLPGSSTPVSAECVRAAESTAGILEELGHHVEIAHPDALDDPARLGFFGAIWCVNAAAAVAHWSTIVGRELGPGDVEPLTWALATRGRAIPSPDYVLAVQGMQAWARRALAWWRDYDLLLTPTLGELPPRLGHFDEPDDPIAGYLRAGSFTPYTPVANQTGQPALSLPLGTAEHLPVGIHLVADNGREDLLLAVAAQLEAAMPWTARTATVHA
ncbi:MAG TPA: amidase family protein [Acidimicrobiia bacterium]|nr:amidase family protein [Acidimicrobiia bacterium]